MVKLMPYQILYGEIYDVSLPTNVELRFSELFNELKIIHMIKPLLFLIPIYVKINYELMLNLSL